MFKKLADIFYAVTHFYWLDIYKKDKKLDEFLKYKDIKSDQTN